jgi:hypothetical protein
MAPTLLHGTLHATIFEAASLTNPQRATGRAPKFIRKVLLSLVSLDDERSHEQVTVSLLILTRSTDHAAAAGPHNTWCHLTSRFR